MNSDKDTLLSKWIEGTISENELAELSTQFDLNEMSEILTKQESYDIVVNDSAELWDKLDAKISNQKKPKPSNARRWISVAILVGLSSLLFSYFYFSVKNGDQKIITPKSKTTTHLFADNSEVIISPGSKVSYDDLEWNNQRKINLEGQAFFKVVSGPPFIVHAGPGTVRVLGTQFEIWEKDGNMKVSCMEGKVEVENFSGDKQVLRIGESVQLNSSNMSEVMSHSLKNAEFLSGRYNFQKISIVSLASEIERFYDIDVSLTFLVYSC